MHRVQARCLETVPLSSLDAMTLERLVQANPLSRVSSRNERAHDRGKLQGNRPSLFLSRCNFSIRLRESL